MTHPSDIKLSEFLDGELDPAAQQALTEHLVECGECRALLADLRRVLARAQALEDRPPRADLWPGVAAAIGAAPARRWRVTTSLPTLLAAGVALMLLSGGAVAVLLRGSGTGRPGAAASIDPEPQAVLASRVDADRGYDAAIRSLEAHITAGRGQLDSATVRVVEDKLRLIDRAIAEAERAVASDSGNIYLHNHLAQTRLRKLDLLRRTAALTRAES